MKLNFEAKVSKQIEPDLMPCTRKLVELPNIFRSVLVFRLQHYLTR